MESTTSEVGIVAAASEKHCDLHDPARLVIAELQHRVRNVLSLVQCLANQTQSTTVDGYRRALIARIANLSDAYELVERTKGSPVLLTELMQRTLKPYMSSLEDRIDASGPEVELDPHLALPLHMVFHELATNASKHGAFGALSGRVQIRWELCLNGADQKLALQWVECDGPEVTEPRHVGFGLALLKSVMANATVDLDFAPAGFVCRMLIVMRAPGECAEWRLANSVVPHP